MIRCQMQTCNLSLFGGVGAEVFFLDEVLDQGKMSVFDCSKKWIVSFTIFDINIGL